MTYSNIDEGLGDSKWAVGGVAFAGAILILIGAFSTIVGLAAIINDDHFVVTRNYAFNLDTTAWGWIHLVLGVAIVVTGFCLFTFATWARVVAIVLAVVSAINFFLFIPKAPVWSVLLVALSAWVIWALMQTRPGNT